MFGSGHANLTLRTDWRAQIVRAHHEIGLDEVRFHGLLDDDFVTVHRASDGTLSIDFTRLDSTFDFLTANGIRPYVELSFMPSAIASGDSAYMRYQANVTPPRNMSAWAEVVRRVVSHCAERYSHEAVAQWRFEVWNEPNGHSDNTSLATGFWTGTQQQYFELYNASAHAVKGVNGSFQIGGPASAGGGWMGDFVAFVKGNASASAVPCDFVSTHHYPNLENRDSFGRACAGSKSDVAQLGNLPLVLSEYNSGLSGPIPGIVSFFDNSDSAYAAAFVFRSLADMRGIVDTSSYWTFSDVFEEIWLSYEPFHSGYGLLTVDNIAKPAYRAFQILHELDSGGAVPVPGFERGGGEQAADSGPPTSPLLTILPFQHPSNQSQSSLHLTILVANFDTLFNDSTGGLNAPHACMARLSVLLPEPVQPDSVSATVRRIDLTHANAHFRWMEMGRPANLTEEQLSTLHNASQLVIQPIAVQANGSQVLLDISLPPFSTATIDLEVEYS